jgi:hypothetical protein
MTIARTTMAAALALLAALAVPRGVDAALWRVVGVSPDGAELAVVAIEPDPVQGFHRHTLVRFRVTDGSVVTAEAFVPAERYGTLRARGDFDLLRYERGRARVAQFGGLLAAGFRSCRPSALTPLAPPGGPPPPLPARHVLATLPDAPLQLAIEPLVPPSEGGDRVTLRDPTSGAATTLAVIPLHEERLNPYETVRYPLAGVRDALLCAPPDAPPLLVVVVESVDPPQPDRPPEQHLLVGGRVLAFPAPAPPAEEAAPGAR